MIGFSKSMAREVASRGITVNVVSPGFIDTDMTKVLSDEQKEAIFKDVPANRLGHPEEIAGTVAFLEVMWLHISLAKRFMSMAACIWGR